MNKIDSLVIAALGIVGVLGIASVVLAAIYGTVVGNWVDANSAVTFPSAISLLILAGIGVLVAAIALAASVMVLRHNLAMERKAHS